MKQLILGSAFGKVAMNARNTLELVSAAISRSEQIGCLANDQLATHLVTHICKSQKIFVDVGAHIGSVISSVVDHDSTISIIAIEAFAEKAKKLFRKFPNIEPHNP